MRAREKAELGTIVHWLNARLHVPGPHMGASLCLLGEHMVGAPWRVCVESSSWYISFRDSETTQLVVPARVLVSLVSGTFGPW